MKLKIIYPTYAVDLKEIVLEVPDGDPASIDNDLEFKTELLKKNYPDGMIFSPEALLKTAHEHKREAFKITALP